MYFRFISIFLCLCLMPTTQGGNGRSVGVVPGTATLAPESVFSDMGESGVSGDFALASIVTQMVMKELDRIADIRGVTDVGEIKKAYRRISGLGRVHSGIDFRILPVIPHFREIMPLDNGEFLLPVSINRSSRDSRTDIQLVVSVFPEGGHYPIRLASTRDLERIADVRQTAPTSDQKYSDFKDRVNKFWWRVVEISEEEVDFDALGQIILAEGDKPRDSLLFRELERLGIARSDVARATRAQLTEALNGIIRTVNLKDKLNDHYKARDLSFGRWQALLVQEHTGDAFSREEEWWFNRGIVEIVYPVRKMPDDMLAQGTEEKYVVAARKTAAFIEDQRIPDIEELDLRSWKAVLLSRLYAFGDHDFVISFVERVKNMEDRTLEIRNSILNCPEILLLYLAACSISPETQKSPEKVSQEFFQKHMAYFFRGTDFYSDKMWTERDKEVMYDYVRVMSRKILEIARDAGDLELFAYVADELDSKTRVYPDLEASLGKVLADAEPVRRVISDGLMRERAAKVLARQIAVKRGAPLRDRFDEYIDEIFDRFPLYVRRAVAYATGTASPAGVEMPAMPSHLGDDIIVKEELPPELDIMARKMAIDVAGSELTLDMLKVEGIANNKVSEKVSAVGHISDSIIERFRKKHGEESDILSRLKDRSFFRLFEYHTLDHISSDHARRLEFALGELPGRFWMNGFHRLQMAGEFAELGINVPEVLERGSALVFSERVTFDEGLGVFLAKLARSDIKVAVIATSDSQRGLIDAINRDLESEQKIKYADTIAEVRSVVRASRFYYFKVEGDPDGDIGGMTTFDITGIVDRIIETIGSLTGIVQPEQIQQLYNAARAFAEAA